MFEAAIQKEELRRSTTKSVQLKLNVPMSDSDIEDDNQTGSKSEKTTSTTKKNNFKSQKSKTSPDHFNIADDNVAPLPASQKKKGFINKLKTGASSRYLGAKNYLHRMTLTPSGTPHTTKDSKGLTMPQLKESVSDSESSNDSEFWAPSDGMASTVIRQSIMRLSQIPDTPLTETGGPLQIQRQTSRLSTGVEELAGCAYTDWDVGKHGIINGVDKMHALMSRAQHVPRVHHPDKKDSGWPVGEFVRINLKPKFQKCFSFYVRFLKF